MHYQQSYFQKVSSAKCKPFVLVVTKSRIVYYLQNLKLKMIKALDISYAWHQIISNKSNGVVFSSILRNRVLELHYYQLLVFIFRYRNSWYYQQSLSSRTLKAPQDADYSPREMLIQKCQSISPIQKRQSIIYANTRKTKHQIPYTYKWIPDFKDLNQQMTVIVTKCIQAKNGN